MKKWKSSDVKRRDVHCMFLKRMARYFLAGNRIVLWEHGLWFPECFRRIVF